MTQPFNNSSSQEDRRRMLLVETMARTKPVETLTPGELKYLYGVVDVKLRSVGEDDLTELDFWERRHREIAGEIERRRGPQRHRPHEPPKGTSYRDVAGVEAILDAQAGRFAQATVVSGSDPATMYPRQPEGSPWAGDPVPPEGPLGYEIHACEPVGEPHELRASMAARTAAPAHPSSGVAVEPPPTAPETLSSSAVFPQRRDERGYSTIRRMRRVR
jgi:hypothetical protein